MPFILVNLVGNRGDRQLTGLAGPSNPYLDVAKAFPLGHLQGSCSVLWDLFDAVSWLLPAPLLPTPNPSHLLTAVTFWLLLTLQFS